MSRSVRPRSSLSDNLKLVGHIVPWRLLLLVPFLLAFAIPAFLLGTDAGHHFLPSLTNFFYNLSNSTPSVSPTPMPPLTQTLPQPGAITYTIRDGDACDAVLISQMHMSDANEIFSDANPQTIQALNSSIGQNCGQLQPGDVVTLMPQYPLVALGGLIKQANALSSAQPIPTPLIRVQRQQRNGVDCSNGCSLTVQIASGVQIKLSVTTGIPVPIGGWIWAQATYPRKVVSNFSNYPYADLSESLNGAALVACDVQINDTHDDNSLSCTQLKPNTIRDDQGAWLYGVTGSGSLDHWAYNLHLPAGVPVLLWLSTDRNGNLVYHKGNQLYRYDNTLHLYVEI